MAAFPRPTQPVLSCNPTGPLIKAMVSWLGTLGEAAAVHGAHMPEEMTNAPPGLWGRLGCGSEGT
eukprot:9984619-Alexandrium_andersonii.AAC.1